MHRCGVAQRVSRPRTLFACSGLRKQRRPAAEHSFGRDPRARERHSKVSATNASHCGACETLLKRNGNTVLRGVRQNVLRRSTCTAIGLVRFGDSFRDPFWDQNGINSGCHFWVRFGVPFRFPFRVRFGRDLRTTKGYANVFQKLSESDPKVIRTRPQNA